MSQTTTEHKYAEVTNGIFIGNYLTAVGVVVKQLNVGLVVKCETETARIVRGVKTILVEIEDDKYERSMYSWLVTQITPAVDAIHKFVLENPPSRSNILVHCYAGRNRSAFVIGYYLRQCGHSYEHVIELLTAANKHRGVTAIDNSTFLTILKEYNNDDNIVATQ